MEKKILKNIAIDFMAKGAEHSLYHLGFVKNYPDTQVFLDKNSEFLDAKNAYRLEIKTDNIVFKSKKNNIISLFHALNKNQKIDILGVHLRFAVVLFLLSFLTKRKISIHMHGQVHSLREKKLKYYLWRMISRRCTLLIANPAYSGPNFVKKIQNINHISKLESKNNNRVKTGTARKNIEKILISDKYEVIHIENSSYKEYVDTNLNCSHVMICFNDDYYMYSPSGRLSDARNFSQKVLILAPSVKLEEMAINICNKYGVDYEIVRD